jgi:hypothetical protein
MREFIGEDALKTFEGRLAYQAVDLGALTTEELAFWRDEFDAATTQRKNTRKVGRMKLRKVVGERRYAVAVRDADVLWLTLWIRRSPKGEFSFFSRAPMATGILTPVTTWMARSIRRAMIRRCFHHRSVSR